MKIAEVEDTGALPQLPPPGELPKALHDPPREVRQDLQPVVAGEDTADLQRLHPLHGPPKQHRVRGGVESVQTAEVKEVSGVEIPPLRLVEAAVSRGVAGGVEHGQHPASQVQHVPVPEDPPGRTLEDFVIIQREVRRKIAGLGREISFHHREREGEVPVQPVPLRLVDRQVLKQPVSAGVVPVDVGGEDRDRQVRQALHHRPDVPHAQAGVDERRPLPAQQEVAVGLLPVAVFADGIGVSVHPFHREPALRSGSRH